MEDQPRRPRDGKAGGPRARAPFGLQAAAAREPSWSWEPQGSGHPRAPRLCARGSGEEREQETRARGSAERPGPRTRLAGRGRRAGAPEPPSRSRLPAAGPSPRGLSGRPARAPREEGAGREGEERRGACRRSPIARHPPWRGESMGFAHSRCNSITALITISISRPDCLLICGKHMSGEVHIPDSAPLPKVQFRGGGEGEGRASDFLLHPLALSASVNYEDPPLSGIWRLYTFLNIVSQSLQIFTLK